MKQILNNPDLFPNEEVLQGILGNNLYPVYSELNETIRSSEYAIEPEWRFYKDGNAWLYKAVCKKKTIFWLSVWDEFIKVGFYFTKKTKEGVSALSINEEIKKEFAKTEATGKLIPLILDITDKEQLPDFLEIVRYKKTLK
jgi:hypothetical protein